MSNDNTVQAMNLDAEDMAAWKNDYYPKLVQGGIVLDGKYFQNPLVNPNLGIGVDGALLKYEYVQFQYRCYRILVDGAFPANKGVKYIKKCIDMLEPYLGFFENKGTGNTPQFLSEADKKVWLSDYYPHISATGLICDAEFFGDAGREPYNGIGSDAGFYGRDIFHFLYQCYRYVYYTLPINS
jgi:hypothetical protein